MNDAASERNPTRLFAIVFLVVLLSTAFVLAFKMFFVLFAGVLFALLLRTAAAFVCRVIRLPYGVALTVLVLAGIAGSTVGAWLLVPSVEQQLEELGRDLPKMMTDLRNRFESTPIVGQVLSANTGNHFDPKSAGRAALGALGGSVAVLSGLVITFFIGVYGAAQPESYVKAALSVAPRRYERYVERALHEIAHNLTRWLWGRILAMAFVGTTTSIVFHLLHLPLALTLGLLAGLLTFIEYAGAILSAVPPVLLGFSQSSTTGLAVFIAYVVLHVIEGYVLTPLLARASVHLPPALTLAAQALLGEIVGVLGLTFSTPLFVVAVSAAKAFREEREHTSTRDDTSSP
ncbi:MAG TPA: AI-2E family transporter [Polyangiaceae bacterium]|nr:AI-2E family transporter [Polyangiaceae bacterium]